MVYEVGDRLRMNNLLIGTGFYSKSCNWESNLRGLASWIQNTNQICGNIVIVDNAEKPISRYLGRDGGIIRNQRNLGHVGDSINSNGPLLGWSMSWIQPSLIAYAEGCDYIYKEQDCFAFGDWVPYLTSNQPMTTGVNSQMPCEQSLFYLRHHFILRFVAAYMSIVESDRVMSPEQKFVTVMKMFPDECAFHKLPGGRDRPLPDLREPFYAQRLTPEEMKTIQLAGLI